MSDTTTGIQEDLDTIGALLDELGQHTPAELREALDLCTENHVHRGICHPRYKLIVYVHSHMPWGPVWLRTSNTAYIQYSLPYRDSSQREWRELPWPPALQNIFFF
ncbi:MAG TPA: hypothetical protein PJ993_02590 [Candidatus Saccharibacteria bacterium]|nr:hypothetical protein [Candidatus Saccharibacteria bacterium]HMT39793.1 hypothetical protein [Candidatus Saccharibacteria bacterium]